MILTLVWLGNFSFGLIQLSGSPVQITVASQFHLSAAEVATWVNLPLLTGALFSIPAGLSVDWFGGRRLVTVGLFFIGFFGLVRGLAPTFSLLCLATFMFGIGQSILLSGMPIMVSQWFSRREMGLAVGIYSSGAAVGVLAVFLLAPPLFHDRWRELFLATGLVGIFSLLTWIVWGKSNHSSKEKKEAAELRAGDLRVQFLHLIRQPDVRWLVVISSLFNAAFFAWLAFGFPFLVLIEKVSEESAGTSVSLTMVGFLVGTILSPALSDRLGLRRPFLMLSGALGALLFVLLPSLTMAAMWIPIFVMGLCFGTLQALIVALPLELDSVAKEQIGTCEGVLNSAGFLAGILASPFLGALIGDFHSAGAANFRSVWLVTCAMMLGVVVASLPIQESGWRAGRKRRPAEPPAED